MDEPDHMQELNLEQRLDIAEAMLKGIRTNITRLDWRLQELEEWAHRTNRKLK